VILLLVACSSPPSPDAAVVPAVPAVPVQPVAPTPAVPLPPPPVVNIAQKDYPYEGNPALGQKATTVHYAEVSGLDPAIQGAINTLLSPEAAAQPDGKPGDYDEWEARVVWNADGVLQVAYDVEYMGAYPSPSTLHVPIDVRTGTIIRPSQAFGSDTTKLRATIDAELAKRRAGHEADIKREIPDATPDDPLMASLVDAHIGEEELASFELDAAGIKFEHDYGTPHAALALLPPDSVTLDWPTVAPLVNPTGPLAAVAQSHHR
jgi:hypothetical protein